ncbi:unnamed protein product [Prorocentrum cordatum]|uniref:C2 domain-containing protein n=1 Tax=Prorocentrum cordatum TaxID=2364126 RepID=A0ABN9X0K6_9DINO|nr:unnamed protein product [Polarella glacialis]
MSAAVAIAASQRRVSTEAELLQQANQQLRDKNEEDALWMIEIIIDLWPRICSFVGQEMKEQLAKVSAKMNIGLPLNLFESVDKFADHLKRHPIPLPIETSWINLMIEDAWGFIQPALQEAVKTVLLPQIRQKLPAPLRGLDIDPCTIGKQPPRVTKWTTEDRNKYSADGLREYIDMTVALEWNGDLDISVNGPPFKGLINLGIKGICLKMELHICLMDMLDRPPFFGGINVWAVTPPTLMLDWSGILNVLDVDVLQSLIQREVASAVTGILCLPNRIGVGVDPATDIQVISCPRPEGLLKLKVVGATGLRTDDFHLLSIWNKKRTCDPYVHIQLGARSMETQAVMRSTGDAEWNSTFYLLVDEFFDQHFDFSVFDWDLIGGDDPLARKLGVKIKDLVGATDTSHVPDKTVSKSTSLAMEVVWTSKLQKEKEAKEVEFAEGHQQNLESPGLVRRALAKTGGAIGTARTSIVDGFNKRTGAAMEEWEKLDSRLQLEVTWVPFECNESVARRAAPDASGPFHSLLFVGVYGCHDLAHEAVGGVGGVDAADPVRYFVKADMGMDTAADKEEELDRKIRQLVDCRVPFDSVAEVLDLSPDRVMSVINEQASSMETEHIDIIWNHPFQFLLADPSKAEVAIQVMKTEPGMTDKVVGKLNYNVRDLVVCDQLTVELQEPLKECSDSKTKIKVKLQLRTLYLGPQYPARVGGREPAPDPAVLRAAAKKRQKQRYVYLDRMGNARTQVNGMWMETADIAAAHPHSVRGNIGSWVHKEVAMASSAMHSIGDKMRHMFHRDKAGERASLTAPTPGR